LRDYVFNLMFSIIQTRQVLAIINYMADLDNVLLVLETLFKIRRYNMY